MARKYLRLKRDGFVMNFNETSAANTDFEVFESIDPPPEYIKDLLAYNEEQRKKLAARAEKRAAPAKPAKPAVDADLVAKIDDEA